MYSQNPQQGQNVFLNGSNHSHSRYGGVHVGSKPFAGSGHAHRGQQDHIGQVHGGSYVSHQHNGSTPTFTAAGSHFTPGQLRNGTHVTNGVGRALTDSHQKQIEFAEQSRNATGAHFHARNSNTNKAPSLAALNALKDKDGLEPEERQRVGGSEVTQAHRWSELDMGGQGMKALTPHIFMYYPFLTSLYLNNNRLETLPKSIGELRHLTHLDVSQNALSELPAEIGMLVNLKSLWVFDNNLQSLPNEIGYLHQLDMLGIDGNPLDEHLKNYVLEEGAKPVVEHFQSMIEIPTVMDRPIVTVNELAPKGSAQTQEAFSVFSYNTLCDRAATRALYGYTPESVLAWENRREVIMAEIQDRKADILCLQEVDVEAYNEFYRPKLAHDDFKGVYFPKTRARTMTEKEAKIVDGCATFYKHSKYVLLEKACIDLAGLAIKRLDMVTEADVFNRIMVRDNIVTVTFLEERVSGARIIVANAHLHWDVMCADVKVVQTAILLEELARLAETYAKIPPCKDKTLIRYGKDETNGEPEEEIVPGPSQEYSKGTQIPLLLCGDFNSIPTSGVYELISQGSLRPDHPDITSYKYGKYTRDGITHPFNLKSAYGSMGELKFTNYTPGFSGVLDYIWFSTSSLQVVDLLGDIDEAYIKKVPGFPNLHFPSDHVALLAKFVLKARKPEQGQGGRRRVEGERA